MKEVPKKKKLFDQSLDALACSICKCGLVLLYKWWASNLFRSSPPKWCSNVVFIPDSPQNPNHIARSKHKLKKPLPQEQTTFAAIVTGLFGFKIRAVSLLLNATLICLLDGVHIQVLCLLDGVHNELIPISCTMHVIRVYVRCVCVYMCMLCHKAGQHARFKI